MIILKHLAYLKLLDFHIFIRAGLHHTHPILSARAIVSATHELALLMFKSSTKLMLFLYALLFFVLGTSLAAVTPGQPHIAALYQPENKELPLSKFHARTNLFERINGVWICVSKL